MCCRSWGRRRCSRCCRRRSLRRRRGCGCGFRRWRRGTAWLRRCRGGWPRRRRNGAARFALFNIRLLGGAAGLHAGLVGAPLSDAVLCGFWRSASLPRGCRGCRLSGGRLYLWRRRGRNRAALALLDIGTFGHTARLHASLVGAPLGCAVLSGLRACGRGLPGRGRGRLCFRWFGRRRRRAWLRPTLALINVGLLAVLAKAPELMLMHVRTAAASRTR